MNSNHSPLVFVCTMYVLNAPCIAIKRKDRNREKEVKKKKKSKKRKLWDSIMSWLNVNLLPELTILSMVDRKVLNLQSDQ